MKIGILTSGGDAPGMNACIVALVQNLKLQNHEIFFVNRGFQGLLDNDIELANLKDQYLAPYYFLAGSLICSSRALTFAQDVDMAVANVRQHQLDLIIVIGGSGSYLGAKLLAEKQVATLFIPASIDNDVDMSDTSLGFSSACQEVVNDYVKMMSTTVTHKGICFMEVMGRYCKDLAETSGLAVNADLTITSGMSHIDYAQVAQDLIKIYQTKGSAMVVVSEHTVSEENQNYLLHTLEQELHLKPRWFVLGHLQRGATPNYIDLKLANELAQKAAQAINNLQINIAVVVDNHKITIKPIL
ncbi:6-phosphofructokinase [Ureaplasma ceti]|uniref:6-phosphofructokinase n=1 Tax=Ureaplasma ceti TaxID=3119530 RepID=A0ABP9UC45_9BACT